MNRVSLFRRRRDEAPPPLGYCRRLNQLDRSCPLADTHESCPLARECGLVSAPPWAEIEPRSDD